MRLATPAAVAGAADTAAFLIGRPTLFRTSPGRAVGSLAMLGLWIAAARQSASSTPRGRRVGGAALLMAANTGLLAAHLRARVANPRVFAGVALSALVLAGAVRAQG